MSEQVQDVGGQAANATVAETPKVKRAYHRTGVTKEQILSAYHNAAHSTLADVANSLNMKVSTLGVRLTSLRKQGLLTRELVRAAKRERTPVNA